MNSDEEKTMELVYPMTGEILRRDDPAACARVFAEIREVEAKLKELRTALSEALIDESIRQGSKTLHFENGLTATISASAPIIWDHEVLAELLGAGLPPDRFEALVRAEVSYKVDGSVIRSLKGANPVYAEIIERAQTRIEKPPYVKVA